MFGWVVVGLWLAGEGFWGWCGVSFVSVLSLLALSSGTVMLTCNTSKLALPHALHALCAQQPAGDLPSHAAWQPVREERFLILHTNLQHQIAMSDINIFPVYSQGIAL